MDGFARTLAAAEIWDHSVAVFLNKCLRSGELSEPQTERLKKLLSDLKANHAKHSSVPATKFDSVDEFVRCVESHAHQIHTRDDVSKNRLTKIWFNQTVTWRVLHRFFDFPDIGDQASDQSSLTDECYKAIRQIERFNSDDALNGWLTEEREMLDAYLVALLRRLTSRIGLPLSRASSGLELPLALTQLQELGFFWPVPKLQAFMSTAPNQSLQVEEYLGKTATDSTVASSLCSSLDFVVQKYPGREAESLSLVRDLVTDLMTALRESDETLVPEFLSYLHSNRGNWRSERMYPGWGQKVLSEVYDLAHEGKIVPRLLPGGKIDPDSITSNFSVRLVDCSGNSDFNYSIKFGDDAATIPCLEMSLQKSSDMQKWHEWNRFRNLHKDIENRFIVACVMRCNGDAFSSPAEGCHALIEDDEWLSLLVRNSLDSGSSAEVLTFLHNLGEELHPPVDVKVNKVVFTEQLRNYPGGNKALTRGTASVVDVTRFSVRFDRAQFSYTEPMSREFQDFLTATSELACSAGCAEILAAIREQMSCNVPTSNLSSRFEDLGALLLETARESTSTKEFNLALTHLRALGRTFSAEIELYPANFAFGINSTLTHSEGALFNVSYKYSKLPSNSISSLSRFALKTGQTTSLGEVQLSAGEDVTGYERVIENVSSLPTQIRERIGQFMEQLPGEEVTKADAGKGEDLYVAIFQTLWPEVSEPEAKLLDKDPHLQALRTWLANAVEVRELFKLCFPIRDQLLGSWKKNKQYREANPGEYARPLRFRSVIRPMMEFYSGNSIKEPAIVHVTE